MSKEAIKSQGKKRTIWSNSEQENVINRILAMTGRETTISSAIRDGLKLKLAQLELSKLESVGK